MPGLHGTGNGPRSGTPPTEQHLQPQERKHILLFVASDGLERQEDVSHLAQDCSSASGGYLGRTKAELGLYFIVTHDDKVMQEVNETCKAFYLGMVAGAWIPALGRLSPVSLSSRPAWTIHTVQDRTTQ